MSLLIVNTFGIAFFRKYFSSFFKVKNVIFETFFSAKCSPWYAQISAPGQKTFFMLNSTEHKIYHAHIC